MWKCNLNGDDDEITRWNRDYLWDHKSSLKYIEIPTRGRDKLWKSSLNGNDDEISMWNRGKRGNAMRIAFMTKFQCGKDKYSTALNIQNPSVETRFWEEKKNRCQISSYVGKSKFV